jgi:lipoprotein
MHKDRSDGFMIKKYEKLICVVILCITFIIIACIAKSAIIQAAKYLSSMAVSII